MAEGARGLPSSVPATTTPPFGGTVVVAVGIASSEYNNWVRIPYFEV